ncbi:MAG: fatty acid CoA ligase family protein [Sandaracinaceae bacterium]
MHEVTEPSPRSEITNVAAHLPRVAAAQPFAPAIYFPDGVDRRGRVRYTHLTYRQLDESSDAISRGLREAGIAPGTRVALMVRPSLELFSSVFGLFKAGLVPVMIDPGIGLASMKACLATARPEVFIGIWQAHAARVVLGWAKHSVKTTILVGPPAPTITHTLTQIERLGARSREAAVVPTERDDLAAILFTSGSTGPPKGVVYTHGNFLAQTDAIRRMYGITPGEIDLPTFPLFALFDPALGMTTVIPDMDPTRPAKADPKKIARAVEDFGVTNMFGSPALLDTLSRYGERTGHRLPSLRRVISAGAPVPTKVLARMRGMLDDRAEIVTPYGATECLPVSSIESREVLDDTAKRTAEGAGTCVGRPVPEAEVQVIAIDDGPIARWSDARVLGPHEVGEIVVKGAQATRRYWDAPEHTAKAKIADGDAVRHRMGDLGYFDDDGRLWFCGRKSQRVVGASRSWFTGRVEGVFDAHREVRRSALVGVRGEPVVCVELERGGGASERLIGELREMAERFEATRGLTRFVVHPGFPVDIRHNAKIRREELGRWVEGRSVGGRGVEGRKEDRT